MVFSRDLRRSFQSLDWHDGYFGTKAVSLTIGFYLILSLLVPNLSHLFWGFGPDSLAWGASAKLGKAKAASRGARNQDTDNYAEKWCDALLTHKSQWRIFKSSNIDPNTFQYQGTIDRGIDMPEQGAFGSCWAYAGLREMEVAARKQRPRLHFTLSEDYLITMALYDMALLQLKGNYYEVLKFKAVVDGGAIDSVYHLASTYGIVTEEAWEKNYSFSKNDERNLQFLTYFNGFLKELFMAHKQGKISYKYAALQVRQFLEHITGPWPTKVLVGRKYVTPRQFFNLPAFDGYRSRSNTGQKIAHRLIEQSEKNSRSSLVQAIRRQLDDFQEPVVIAFHVNDIFLEPISGTIQIPRHFDGMGTNIRDIVTLNEGSLDLHAVLVVDYRLNDAGDVAEFLVLNSGFGRSSHGKYSRIQRRYLEESIDSILVRPEVWPDSLGERAAK